MYAAATHGAHSGGAQQSRCMTASSSSTKARKLLKTCQKMQSRWVITLAEKQFAIWANNLSKRKENEKEMGDVSC